MPFYVVLDTCVLLPMPLRDTLLTLAAEELYVPKWAGRSLDSVHELLQSRLGRTEHEADRVRATIRHYFECPHRPGRGREELHRLEQG